MSRVVVRSQEADRDLEEIAAGFDETSEALSHRFLASVTRGFRQLSQMLGLGEKVEGRAPGLLGLRCDRVPNFRNHLVFYRYDDDKVEVARVLHGARDIETILGEFDE